MTRRTRATRLLAAAAALLALASAAPPASAQGATPAGDVTKDATKMLYNAGIDAAKAEQWDKAYESFLAAFKIQQHPQIAVNLGRAAVKTGRPREAAEYLTFFLRETKEQVQNQDRAAIQQLLREAKGKIGTLIVKVNRPGADVVVDGKVVGQAPLRDDVFVEPGKHTVEARLGKERAEPVTVELKAGDSRQVGLAVGAKLAAGEGELAGPTGPGQAAPEAGGPPSAVERVIVPVGIAAGALGVLAGGVMTGLSFWKAGARDELCTPQSCPSNNEGDWNDAEQQRVMFANAALGSFIAGGAILGGTLVYALIRKPYREKSTAGVRFGVVPSTTEPSVVVTGRW